MSFSMMASCRFICFMVLEEREVGGEVDRRAVRVGFEIIVKGFCLRCFWFWVFFFGGFDSVFRREGWV